MSWLFLETILRRLITASPKQTWTTTEALTHQRLGVTLLSQRFRGTSSANLGNHIKEALRTTRLVTVSVKDCSYCTKLDGIASGFMRPWMFDEEESQERPRRIDPCQRQERNG